ncbi:MAG: aspartate kinase [Bacteroidota bacterium]
MIVMKFGGTSVGTAERIQQVFEIVTSQTDAHPIVVVSAVGGVTDLLLEAGQKALAGEVDIAPIKAKHQQVIEGLSLPADMLDTYHEELENLLEGIRMIKEISPRTSDYLVSFGERISCQLVAAHFRNMGRPSQHHFAFDIGMITDDVFQSALPLPEAYVRIADHLKEVNYTPIITGFVGKNKKGEITTLGRGGSDYTAAILGGAVQAEEIQIWTDVDGILTTDPRLVAAASNVPVVSFKEAAELAYFGAKVLHPKTIRPALERDIPVVVKNTGNADHPGTRIVRESPTTDATVKAISFKKGVRVINIYSLRMLDTFGYLSKVFDIFARHKVVVDMVSTSEVSVSITVDKGQVIEEAVEEVSQFAEVRVEKDLAIVCLVGEGMREGVGIAGKVFDQLARENIAIEMISQGASDINLGFVINGQDADRAVKTLHQVLFETAS